MRKRVEVVALTKDLAKAEGEWEEAKKTVKAAKAKAAETKAFANTGLRIWKRKLSEI